MKGILVKGAAYVIDRYQASRRVRSIRREIVPQPVTEEMAREEEA